MKISSKFIQYTFFVIFILAVLLTFLFLVENQRITVEAMALSLESGEIEEIPKLESPISVDNLNIITSIITVVISLAGFIGTTVFNVRKDKRESLEAAVALKQKEIELERALIELEELKKKSGIS